MKNVIIIAEAGVNHNGDINNAFKLIDAAFEAKVDYIKFQTFKTESVISKDAPKAEYQIENTKNNESQFEMVKKLELSPEQHEQIIDYCNSKGIRFFSTAFDLHSLQYLAGVGLKMVKIPSGELTNLPYLRKAAKLFPEVILSTGMANLQEVRDAFEVFTSAGVPKEKITILHCNTEYPTPMSDVNLMAMLQIRDEFGTEIGYSDHTLGIEVPIAAVALGASVIEKHFTLDRTMDGPDHAASLEPAELIAMVSAIRNVSLAIGGDGLKNPSASEFKNIAIARKSIFANKRIEKGALFTADNLTTKRPGTGISPMQWDSVIGTEAPRDFEENELIVL